LDICAIRSSKKKPAKRWQKGWNKKGHYSLNKVNSAAGLIAFELWMAFI